MKFLWVIVLVVGLLAAGSAHATDNDTKCNRFRLTTTDSTLIEGKYGFFVGESFVFRHLDNMRDTLALSEISSLRRSTGHRGAAFGALVASIGTFALFGGSAFSDEPQGSEIDVAAASGLITMSALLAYMLGSRTEVWEDVSLSLIGSGDRGAEAGYLVLTLRL